jgi:hypothetical protein
MARAQQTKTEHVEVLSSEPIPEVTLPPVSNEAPVVADATMRNPPQAAKGPEVEYFRVTRGGYVQSPGGVRSQLREGKEIDSLNYDPARLRQQGIRLERIRPEERASFGRID